VPFKPLSMLDLIVVKQQATFQLPTFLDGKLPKPEEIVVEQRLVSLKT